MRWTLFSATWICAWRQARPVLLANPLLALLAAAAAAAIPFASIAAGVSLADAFAAAVADPAFTTALAFGLGSTGLVTGVAAALLVPDAFALGTRLETVPVSRRTLVLAATLGPVAAAGGAFAFVALLFAVPLAGASGPALVLAPAASALLGAAFAEGVRLVLRRRPTGVAVCAAAVASWAAGGYASGAVATGPIAALATALDGAVAAPTVWLAAAALVGAALWFTAAALPRGQRPAIALPRRSLRLPHGAALATAVASAVRLVRHARLRLHVAAMLVVPVAATIVLRAVLDLGGEALVAFCVGLALPAAAILPAAARGLDADTRWLLASSPARPPVLAAAAVAGGVAVAFALVALDAVAAAPFARADAVTYFELEAATAFVVGSGALAAAAVPWQPDHAVQQVGSYGATVAVTLALWLVAGRLQAPADAIGLSGVWFSAAVGHAVLALGLGGVAVAR